MPVETPSLFAQVIKDHLALKERNAQLDGSMSIEGYKAEDPFRNHPLFKSEEQARIEETMDGAEPVFTESSVEDTVPWPGDETVESTTAVVTEDSGFWGDQAREFDWGD
ncbi:MAG TPA: hypothetical protein VJ986_07155 [Gaiellaceae bacterium]|nr:hypothetical protein [Gaiellaceae bacterium]